MRLFTPVFVVSLSFLSLPVIALCQTFVRPAAKIVRIDPIWPSAGELWNQTDRGERCNYSDQEVRIEQSYGSKFVSFHKNRKRYILDLQATFATQPGMISIYQDSCNLDRTDESRRMFIETLVEASKSDAELRHELATIRFEERIATRATAPIFIEKSAFSRMPILVSWSRSGIRFVADTQSGDFNAYDEHGNSVRTPELIQQFVDAVNDQLSDDAELSAVIRNSTGLRSKFN